MLGAGFYTYKKANDFELESAQEMTGDCIEHHDADECVKRSEKYLDTARGNNRVKAELVAFVPVPFAWAFVYLLIFIVRWIKRGFARAA